MQERGRESPAAILVHVFVCSPSWFAIGSPRLRLRVARNASLIPAKAGIWTSHVAPDPCLCRDERKSLNTADAHEGGYLGLDCPVLHAVRFKHGFPSARKPSGCMTEFPIHS